MLVPGPQVNSTSERSGPRRLAILGATGSIGLNTISLVQRYPQHFEVVALSGGRNAERMLECIARVKPRVVAMEDADAAESLKSALRSNDGVQVVSGRQAIVDLARRDDIDTVLAAISGSAGLASVLAALEAGHRVALANKESLVAGGALVKEALRSGGGELLPVDSEHAAIFQALQGVHLEDLSNLILTASGGPFLRASPEQLAGVTPEQAVRHPRWSMGRKISVDSATLVNKALELIEAHWLFGVEECRIKVLVHPQSLVHSMVEFVDGSVLAQISNTDMSGPIGAALCYPRKLPGVLAPFDFLTVRSLDFEALDEARFPAVRIARAALRAGGAATAVFNAANERAVAAFLESRLQFPQIVPVISEVLSACPGLRVGCFADLEELENLVRAKTDLEITARGGC